MALNTCIHKYYEWTRFTGLFYEDLTHFHRAKNDKNPWIAYNYYILQFSNKKESKRKKKLRNKQSFIEEIV